jgi:nucleoside-diphosphate-sugar epimerase
METILLTGATGFLGSHLLEALISSGYKVVILKRSTSNTWRIEHLLEKVVKYDIDKQPVEAAFSEQKIDVVIHTACHYGRNQDPISDVVESNLMFPVRVLEAAILFNVSIFFNTDTLLPRFLNPYSLSKHQFSEWLKQSSEKIQCVNFKIEHIYGPKDDTTKFVPWLLNQMISSEGEINLTKGEQQRDFIYVVDVVAAYLLLLKKVSQLNKWNEFDVCTNQLVTIKTFIHCLQEIVETTTGVDLKGRLNFGAIPYRKGEIMVPEINNSALLKLGWQPKVTLNQGLQVTVKELI